MEKHNINLITYGSRIDTDVNTMADGMIELLDDLCDFALSRVFNSASKLEKKLDLRDLPSLEIAKFRFTWLISLSELMFYSMSEQAKLEHLKNRFYQLVKIDANERSLEIFVDGAISNVKSLINSDRDFVDNEILSFPASNQAEGDPRNHGLGPRLSQLILDNSFGQNQNFREFYPEIVKLIELEFNNAYGHASIACSKFTFN